MSRPAWVMGIVAALGLSYAIGWGMLRLFRVDRSALGWAGRWSCGWLLGAYATSLCLFLLSLAGLRASVVGPLVLAIGVVAAAVAVDPPRRPRLPSLRGLRKPDAPAELLGWPAKALLLLVIAWGLTAITGEACSTPVQDWDGRAIFAIKAKMLFDQPIPETEYFNAMRLSFSHRHYPLLVPFMEVHIWTWLGQPDDWAVMPLFPLFAVALVGAVYTFARIMAGPWAGLVAAAAVALAPRFAYEASTACADVPLGAYHAVLIGAGIWMLRSPCRSKLLLMAAMLAGGIFAKAEGVPNAAVACVVFLAAYWARTRSPRAAAIAALVLASGLAASVPWLAFRRTIPPASFTSSGYFHDLLHVHETAPPGEITSVIGLTIQKLGPTDDYGVFWLVVAAAVLLHPRRLVKAESAFPLAVVLLNIVMYTSAILVIGPPLTPLGTVDAVFPRLLSHLIGPAAILLAIQWFPFHTVRRPTAVPPQ